MGVGCNDRYAPLSVDVVWLCEVVVISLCVVDPLLMDVVVLVLRVGNAIPVLISLLLLVTIDVCVAPHVRIHYGEGIRDSFRIDILSILKTIA